MSAEKSEKVEKGLIIEAETSVLHHIINDFEAESRHSSVNTNRNTEE